MSVARSLRLSLLIAGLFGPWALAPNAGATTISLSSASSDDTPASVLDATLQFTLSGPSELTLSVTNDTAAPDAYNIDGVWFNAAANVSGLALLGATHSVVGDVTAGWGPVLTNDKADGFGHFDFGLVDGVGENHPNLIRPGQTVTFVFAISGTGPYDTGDFVALTSEGYAAAVKFVNGPAENDPTETQEDSAFGAATGAVPIPEPGSAALLAPGLLGLALARRRR